MIELKRIVTILLISLLALIGVGCTNNHQSTTSGQTKKITVAASQVPHAEILEHIKPTLEKEGIELEVKVMQDYVLPNKVVEEGEADANFFQHVPFLEETNEKNGYHLVKVTGVHIEPLGAYSKKVKKIEDLPQKSAIAVPNDPTNLTRALLLLDAHGVIKLDNREGDKTERNIVDLKTHVIKPVEAAILPRVLDEVDLAVINTNYALQAKLNPVKDSLIIEDKNSPYVNILATKQGREKDEAIQKLAKALNSPEVKKFIEEKYKGSVVPAF